MSAKITKKEVGEMSPKITCGGIAGRFGVEPDQGRAVSASYVPTRSGMWAILFENAA